MNLADGEGAGHDAMEPFLDSSAALEVAARGLGSR